MEPDAIADRRAAIDRLGERHVEHDVRVAGVDGRDRDGTGGRPSVDQGTRWRVGQQEAQVTVAEHGLGIPCRGELPVPGGELLIAAVGRVRGPVLGVGRPRHADLVAVVDDRRARKAELHERGQAEARLAHGEVRRDRLLLRRGTRRERPEHALGVVAVEQPEGGPGDRRRLILEHSRKFGGEDGGRQPRCAVVREPACVGRPQVRQQRGAGAVVGDRVGGVATDERQHLVALPRLPDDRRIGLRGLHRGSEPLPEARRKRRVRHRVDAPAAGAEGQPVARHGVGRPVDERLHGGLLFVENGQRGDRVPARVVHRVRTGWAGTGPVRGRREDEPGAVRGADALAGPRCLGLTRIAVEIWAVRADVIEDPVEDDVHSECGRVAHQPLEVCLRAEARVDLVVVARVVAVVGGRREDRVQIEDRHSEAVQVGQLRANAREIAAVVFAAG